MEVRLTSPVAPRSAPPRMAYLRAVCGHDELTDFEHPGAATALLDRLLIDGPGAAVRAGEAANLSLYEHDRVLAAVYTELYGDDVSCRIRCGGCGDWLAVGFSLAELCAGAADRSADDRAFADRIRGPDARGTYELADGLRFRLPTCGDIAELRGLPTSSAAQALRQRCMSADDDADVALVERALELVGPRIDGDLDTECPSCGHAQIAHFGIEDFVCASLQRERGIVVREIHVLARAYRWSRSQLLDMPRSDRRLHVRLVLADAGSFGGWP